MSERLRQNVARKITISEDDFAFFLNLLKQKKLKKREFLLSAGEVCRWSCFVEEGILRSFSVDEKGEEHVLQFAPEDWWIGDMYSAITGRPSQLYIDALEDSTVFLLSTEDGERLFQAVPAFERHFRLLMQGRFIALQERLNPALGDTAEAKYLSFLKKYPTLPQRVPQHQIASFLGLQPETLSRVRKKLSQKKP